MRRRDFIKGGAASLASIALGPRSALAAKEPPDFLPILKDRMAEGGYLPHYVEREITEPVRLCDDRGRLNRDAVGWSRRPLTRCNITGHWMRRKRWNFWCIINPDFAFSVTLADLDYFGLATAFFHDFSSGERIEVRSVPPCGRGCEMPEEVERDIRFDDRKLAFSILHREGGIEVDFRAPSMGGREVTADFVIRKPPGHETMSFVVPWTDERFQYNSKQNTLPAEGTVTVGGRVHRLDPATSHGVLDFGRGVWPYRSCWNWAVGTGTEGGHTIGLNMGAKWTTGTGASENGICLDGRLHKVMEDLHWEYDRSDWMKPWLIRSLHSRAVDVTLTPFTKHEEKLNLGVLATRGAVAYGRWSGTLEVEGQTVKLENLIGWAEEFAHRW